MTKTLHGGMKMYEAAETIIIDTTEVYHLVTGFVADGIHGWTLDVTERTGTITDTFDNGGQLQCEDVAHGLVTGDIVSLTSMQDALHNGVTAITKDSNDLFTCDDITYNSIDDTGDWREGSFLLAGQGAGGVYNATISISGTPAVAAKRYKFELFCGADECNTCVAEATPGANTMQNFAGSGGFNVRVGDRIFLAIENQTDATNFVVEHANVNLTRI